MDSQREIYGGADKKWSFSVMVPAIPTEEEERGVERRDSEVSENRICVEFSLQYR